jgi:REP element-mobilizing transposase RayT
MRLPDFNYGADGAYFVTICVEGRLCLLGEIVGDRAILTPLGHAVAECWQAVPGHFMCVDLGPFVIMPNHVHGMVWIASDSIDGGSTSKGLAGPPTLGQIIGWFKYESTKRINAVRGTPGLRVWQRNYYDHIVRTEEGLYAIAEYIDGNPRSWRRDEMNPAK